MSRSSKYPTDDVLVEWAQGSNRADLARRVGVSASSLRDYLKIRPVLEAKVRAVYAPPLTEEQKKANLNRAQAEWKKENPEKVREINRRWAKSQSPVKRAKWNNYNRLRRKDVTNIRDSQSVDYAEILAYDPCSYCGTPADKPQSIDHVVPIVLGGLDTWENFTSACRSCNSRKQARPLLKFMLARTLELEHTND